MGVEDEERTGVVTLSGRRDDIRLWGGVTLETVFGVRLGAYRAW